MGYEKEFDASFYPDVNDTELVRAGYMWNAASICSWKCGNADGFLFCVHLSFIQAHLKQWHRTHWVIGDIVVQSESAQSGSSCVDSVAAFLASRRPRKALDRLRVFCQQDQQERLKDGILRCNFNKIVDSFYFCLTPSHLVCLLFARPLQFGVLTF